MGKKMKNCIWIFLMCYFSTIGGFRAKGVVLLYFCGYSIGAGFLRGIAEGESRMLCLHRRRCLKGWEMIEERGWKECDEEWEVLVWSSTGGWEV
ncbi:uncharacterized protein G2W53_028644 [Senna tora]|uniref:Transmembrane protein n=1 Tax=Senna tora TaxID=362788 RepID=A0A834T336_9FABA|nr:uncharacterized protein G2W53_028644 [Senna tora]